MSIQTADGKTAAKTARHLRQTGISGIPVFQVSRYAAKLLDQKKKVLASLNFLPDLDETKVRYLLREQREVLSGETAEDFLSGIFNKKLASVLLKAAKIQTDKKAGLLTSEELERLGATIREFKIPVKETNPFEQAQICTGGVDTAEIEAETMRRNVFRPLYSRELLDVDGICGGYNLQWAWSSGYAADVMRQQELPRHLKNSRAAENDDVFRCGETGPRETGKEKTYI
ncbi:MAG: NAD(P)/FAD-dependent oxidoreductase [Clostridium sp.]